MSEEKKRRTPDELKALYQAKLKALDEKNDLKAKRELLRIANVLADIAKERPAQPQIGQASTLISQAAAAIKAEIPQ